MVKKTPIWPAELKRPIRLDALALQLPTSLAKEDFKQKLTDAFIEDVLLRFGLLCKFLNRNIPDNEAAWIDLVIALCDHWNIPAFHASRENTRRAGAPKIWTPQKHCELFADVKAMQSKSRLSEFAACKFIAKNPKTFGKRYLVPSRTTPERWGHSIHRQFVAAKKLIKTDIFFRLMHFNKSEGLYQGLFGPPPEYGDELIAIAIERYALAR
jgi:hypothetical protein